MENKLYDIADTLGYVIRDQANSSLSQGLSKRHGTVTQVKTDGSLMVVPDGSNAAISCGSACAPRVGDRVVILVEGSQWLAIGTVGGDGVPATLQPSRTIDCTIANLQATINGLQKLMMNNVTIRVQAGTITTAITVDGFFGYGTLEIQAVNASNVINTTPNSQTHCASAFTVQNCNINSVLLRGFTATTTTGNCFLVQRNSAWVGLYTCNATVGPNTTTANVGVYSYIHNTLLYLADCTISNKYIAVLCRLGQVTVAGGTAGTGNNMVFRAEQAGVIRIESVGTIAGTLLRSITGAARIIPGPIPLWTGMLDLSSPGTWSANQSLSIAASNFDFLEVIFSAGDGSGTLQQGTLRIPTSMISYSTTNTHGSAWQLAVNQSHLVYVSATLHFRTTTQWVARLDARNAWILLRILRINGVN